MPRRRDSHQGRIIGFLLGFVNAHRPTNKLRPARWAERLIAAVLEPIRAKVGDHALIASQRVFISEC